MNQKIENYPLYLSYISDSPVNNFDNDNFNYKPIAENVASSILQINAQFGYVISITGKWGSGKSSFIFYVERYLKNKKTELNDIVVFKFDPWIFSGHQDIIDQFFKQLQAQAEVAEIKSGISEDTINVLDIFFEYGSLLKAIPTLEGQCAGWGFHLLHMITSYYNKTKSPVKSLLELKVKLTEKIKTLQQKIVIFIDDIDRLTPEEIRELFRAIKAIGDFPNIVYILAYDEEIVTSVLDADYSCQTKNSSQNSEFGKKYLEKIVSFSIPLPVISEFQLEKYVDDVIFDDKFENTYEIFVNKLEWKERYYEGINKLLTTPRSVIRLNNALLLLYPSIKNEVDVIDFISLEIIRQNYSELYDWIRNNPRLFISMESDMFSRRDSSDIYREQFNNIIDSFPEKHRNALENILKRMFPNNQIEIQNAQSPKFQSNLMDPRRQGICLNYDTFLKYFRYQLDPEVFSHNDMLSFLNSTPEPQVFAEQVHSWASVQVRKKSKIFIFFDYILPLIDENMPLESQKNFIFGCFLINDKIFTYNEVSYSKSIYPIPRDLSMQIVITIFKCFHLMSYDERLELFKSAYSTSISFVLMSDIINLLRQQNGDKNWGSDIRSPQFDVLLRIDDLNQIEDIFIQRIKEELSNNIMRLAGPDISSILYVWNKLSPENSDLNDIINKFWSDDELILKVILSSREKNYLNPILPDSLEPYISENVFREKVQEICSLKGEQLTEKQRRIILEFLKEKMKLKNI